MLVCLNEGIEELHHFFSQPDWTLELNGRPAPIHAEPARPYSEPDWVAKEFAMSFVLYLVGFVLLTGGIAWGLIVAGVPYLYVAIACLILVGLGVISGVSKTRLKDPSN